MTPRVIATSASNKFFPSVLNLIGSIKKHYPNHPPIVVYDLGLLYPFQKEVRSIPGVSLVKIPPFVPFWRQCYTWKPYIFAEQQSATTLYLDAGVIVKKSLDPVFAKIETDGYLAVSQGLPCGETIPKEYMSTLNINAEIKEKTLITAGIFGYRPDYPPLQRVITRLYDSAVAGLCLGFSPADSWRNKYPNKTPFVRNCRIFRHDTTLLSVFFHAEIPDAALADIENPSVNNYHLGEYLINVRLLDYAFNQIATVNSKNHWAKSFNRFYIFIFKQLKLLNAKLKHLPVKDWGG